MLPIASICTSENQIQIQTLIPPQDIEGRQVYMIFVSPEVCWVEDIFAFDSIGSSNLSTRIVFTRIGSQG